MLLERLNDMVHGGMLFTFIITAYFFLRAKSYADKPVRLYYAMGALMSVMAVQALVYIVMCHTNDKLTDHGLLSIVVNLTAVPFCVFVVKELVRIHPVTRSKVLVQAGVPLVLAIAYFILLLFHSPLQVVVFIVYCIWMACYTIIYAQKSVRSVKVYGKIINNIYADVNGRNISWLKNTVMVFVLIMILFVFLKIMIDTEVSRIIYGIVTIGFWISLCWQVFCMRNNEAGAIDEDEIMALEEPETSTASPPEELSEEDKMFLEKIRDTLLHDRLYTAENLTREVLAKKMNTNYKYLTTKLKAITGCTFSAYVTDIRMQEAVKMLTTTNMTVEEIFYALGYTTKSTFYRSFKKKYGCTPREYRRNCHLADT